MSADNYADGGVHKLTMGSGELQLILSSAASRNQLVLVDFSASWCGPCRMMEPVLQQLAQEYRSKLAVVKVDCEVGSWRLLGAGSHWGWRLLGAVAWGAGKSKQITRLGWGCPPVFGASAYRIGAYHMSVPHGNGSVCTVWGGT